MLNSLKRSVEGLRPRLRPSILLIGAQKAGTSAVFDMIGQHPKVLAPQVKEIMFFNRDAEHDQGLKHYLNNFPVRPLRGAAPLTLEASVGYLYHDRAAERIKAMLPDVRLAAILRDPVSRAFSAWNMFRQFRDHPLYADLHDPRPFDQAIQDELEGRTVQRAHLYVDRGHYAPQLQRYFDVFGRDALQLFSYGELQRDPRKVVDAILRTVGLDASPIPDHAFGVRRNERPYVSTLPVAVEERLRAHCAGWQEEMEAVLGRTFPLG